MTAALPQCVTLRLCTDEQRAGADSAARRLQRHLHACLPLARLSLVRRGGGLSQTAALFSREADLALVSPAAAVRLLHQAGDLEGLASLGVLRQADQLVAIADAALGLTQISDLPRRAARLRVATAADDGANLTGFAVHRALRHAGVATGSVDFVYRSHPSAAAVLFSHGAADVLIHSTAVPPWQAIDRARPVTYLSWGQRVIHQFAAAGWPSVTMPAGRLPGLDGDLTALDFSHAVLLCRRDLDTSLAAAVAAGVLGSRLPLAHGALTEHPLPLHPGAERAYADEAADGVHLPVI